MEQHYAVPGSRLDKLQEERTALLAALVKARQEVIDVTRDRNEWRDQHENLLAMYRAELSKHAAAI